MFNTFFGTKLNTVQAFNNKGNRLVVTNIKVDPAIVTQLKSQEKDGYWALQLAFGQKSTKKITKPIKFHLKGAKLSRTPLFLREIKRDAQPTIKVGDQVKISDIFKTGDKIKVTGLSKGRGFAGVMKRWGFAGGPRTHGQSDRQRSPGSIGQRTDPGRVWKGKKMPGHYGYKNKTIIGLRIFNIDEDKNILQVSGTVPGSRNSLLKIIHA